MNYSNQIYRRRHNLSAVADIFLYRRPVCRGRAYIKLPTSSHKPVLQALQVGFL